MPDFILKVNRLFFELTRDMGVYLRVVFGINQDFTDDPQSNNLKVPIEHIYI